MERIDDTIELELMVLTDSSVWLVRPDTYQRLPRGEQPRPPIEDIDGATRDGIWHPHEGVWLVDDDDLQRLSILPSGRPPGSQGLLSGVIRRIGGR